MFMKLAKMSLCLILHLQFPGADLWGGGGTSSAPPPIFTCKKLLEPIFALMPILA